MPVPFNERDFDVFLSHAHKDATFVSELDKWLTTKAGLSVWFDRRELPGGSLLATDLERAINRCRGLLLVASEKAATQGWVWSEYNSAMDQHNNDPAFRVVPLRLANANVDDLKLMRGMTWIDVPEPRLDPVTALATLSAFYPGERLPNPRTARDVFISCSWQPDDSTSARAVCRSLMKQGFRLIGDARDQEGFGKGNRTERIISSCGAFVGIVPYRDPATARRTDPYKYFFQEMDFAAQLGLPRIIVADARVERENSDHWLKMDTAADVCPPPIGLEIEKLNDAWRKPPNPQYIFFAVDLEDNAAAPSSSVRGLLERITGMPTVLGNEITDRPVHDSIIAKISKSFVTIADITDNNTNVCIEAGVALGAGTNVELIAHGKPRRPPYMLSHIQMPTYESETEQIGLMHKIARRYRRRILNGEL
jgi:hypothetical protein